MGERLAARASTRICCQVPSGSAFVDIDSLPCPAFDCAKRGARYGHTKTAGKQILRTGRSPLIATISNQAVATTRAAGVTRQILVRGDSVHGDSTVVGACGHADGLSSRRGPDFRWC